MIRWPAIPSGDYRMGLVVGICLALVLSACNPLNSSDENSLEPGTFEVQVEGYVNQSFEGEAEFESIFGRHYLELRYYHSDESLRYILFSDETKPETGNSTLVHGLFYSDTAQRMFESEDVPLSITKSREDVLEGSFDFTASNGDHEVQITGTFYAQKGRVQNIDVL